MNVRRLAAVVLLLAASSLNGASLRFGAEVPATTLDMAPVAASMYGVGVASNGDGFFVVWTDSRSGNAVLYGARISREGSLLDAAGIPLSPDGGYPRVVWTGRRYLVAVATSQGASVIAVDADGSVGPAQEVIHGIINVKNFALATNGDSALLVTTNLGAVLTDASGRKLRDIGLSSPLIDVASDGHDYMVVTAGRLGVESHRVTGAGDVAPPQYLTGDESSSVAIAFGRDRYLVAWTTNMTLGAAALGIDGTPGAEHVAAKFAPPATFFQPRLVWRAGEFLALVGSGGTGPLQRYAVRLADDGMPLELPSGAFYTSSDWQAPDAAATSDGTALVATPQPLAGFLLQPHAASAFTARPLANAPPSQTEAAIASVGGDPLIAWREGTAIYARRGSGPPVAVTTTSVGYGSVGLASDGGTVWVWWLDRGSIVVRRYTPQMQPVDPAPVAAGAAVGAASGAAGGGKLLLTWMAYDGDLRGLLLDSEGPGIAAPFILAPSPYAVDHDPAVVWTGSDFVVAWAHSLWYDPGNGGLPLPPDDIRLVHVSVSGGADLPLTIAYGQAAANVRIAALGTDLAVAWQYDGWSPGVYGGIWGSVVRSGLPTPARRWMSGAALPNIGGLVARRDDYLLVWAETASNVESRIAHRLIDRDGIADEIATLAPFRRSSSLVLFAGSIGTAPFLVYSRAAEETPFSGAIRLFMRLLDTSPRVRAAR